MRLKLCLPPSERPARLKGLLALGFEDLVYVYTCNRVEFYTTGKDLFADSRPLWLSLLQTLGLSEEDFYRGYHLEGKSAVRHLLRVASSLESLVVGEPQILGQLKDALRLSKESGIPVSGQLERSFHLAFETAKRVRTETAIGEKAVSVATLGLQHARAREDRHPFERAVVVGRSPISTIVVQWLKKNRPGCPILWVNRNLAALEAMPESAGCTLMSLSDFLGAPPPFSHLFTATSSLVPLFRAEFFAKVAGGRPKLMFDFAQPPDVEVSDASREKAHVFTLADLGEEARRNAESRATAVRAAEAIIEEALRTHCFEQKQAPLLRDFNGVEPRFAEELAAACLAIEKELPIDVQPKVKKLVERVVKKNLHSSREHLREILRHVSEPDEGPDRREA